MNEFETILQNISAETAIEKAKTIQKNWLSQVDFETCLSWAQPEVNTTFYFMINELVLQKIMKQNNIDYVRNYDQINQEVEYIITLPNKTMRINGFVGQDGILNQNEAILLDISHL